MMMAAFLPPARCGHPPVMCADHQLTINPGEEVVNLQIVSKTAGAGSLFWKTEAIPSGAMPAFPEPLGADSPPAAVLLPNSPLLIHASSSSMSSVSSRMPVLAVTSGKGRKSPEGHCQLSRAHSVPTPPPAVLPPNSPSSIQVRSSSMSSATSSGVSALVVTAGKARPSPVGQRQLCHSQPVRTACRPLCSP